MKENIEPKAEERMNDAYLLDLVDEYLIILIKGTSNAYALECLTKALCETRRSRSCLEKFGVNFYKGIKT